MSLQMAGLLLSSPKKWVDGLPEGSVTNLYNTLKESLGDFCESNPTTSVFLCICMLYYFYYVKNIVRKPELICSDEGFKKFLIENCPILTQEFKPTFWSTNTHAQTLLANGIRAVIPIPQYRREFVPVDDEVPPRKNLEQTNTCNKTEMNKFQQQTTVKRNKNCRITLDWYESRGGLSYPELLKFNESDLDYSPSVNIEDNGKPIAIFLPGLVGDSTTEYIRTALIMAYSIGYKTCVFNNRGRGGLKLKSDRLYSATNWDDLEEAFKHIRLTHPKSKLVAVGISLGGIVLCKYLAERGDKALVDAAMLVSVCFDFIAGCKSLEKPGLNSALNLHLTKTLLKIVEENREILEENQNYYFEEIFQSKNMKQFDSRFTSKMWGYNSVEEYHQDASNKDRLHLIRKPTLCINAADDMFCPLEFLPLKQIEQNPKCAMLITARGGHIGFMDHWFPIPIPMGTSFYLERVIVQYLDCILKFTDS